MNSSENYLGTSTQPEIYSQLDNNRALTEELHLYDPRRENLEDDLSGGQLHTPLGYRVPQPDYSHIQVQSLPDLLPYTTEDMIATIKRLLPNGEQYAAETDPVKLQSKLVLHYTFKNWLEYPTLETLQSGLNNDRIERAAREAKKPRLAQILGRISSKFSH